MRGRRDRRGKGQGKMKGKGSERNGKSKAGQGKEGLRREGEFYIRIGTVVRMVTRWFHENEGPEQATGEKMRGEVSAL